MDVNITFSDYEDSEVVVTLDCYLIRALAVEINAIDRRFGPDRDVGPVRFILRKDETLITIGTQKQGDQEYYLGEYGELREGYPELHKHYWHRLAECRPTTVPLYTYVCDCGEWLKDIDYDPNNRRVESIGIIGENSGGIEPLFAAAEPRTVKCTCERLECECGTDRKDRGGP